MFAVVMAALLGSFHIAIDMRENAYERIEEGLPKHYVIDIVKRDFTTAAAPAGVLAGPFIGENEEVGSARLDTLEFFSTTGMVDEEEPWSELQKIEYYLLEPEDDREGLDFVRAITRNLLPLDEEEPEEQLLLEGVSSLAIEYFDGTDWTDSWDSTLMGNQCPPAVSMLIEFLPEDEDEEDSAPNPLEIIVALEARAIISEDAQARGGMTGDTGGEGGGR